MAAPSTCRPSAFISGKAPVGASAGAEQVTYCAESCRPPCLVPQTHQSCGERREDGASPSDQSLCIKTESLPFPVAKEPLDRSCGDSVSIRKCVYVRPGLPPATLARTSLRTLMYQMEMTVSALPPGRGCDLADSVCSCLPALGLGQPGLSDRDPHCALFHSCKVSEVLKVTEEGTFINSLKV